MDAATKLDLDIPTFSLHFARFEGAFLLLLHEIRMQFGSFTLAPHQQAAVKRLCDPGCRGLIMFFAVGAGKTLTSIAAAQLIMQTQPSVKEVVVVMPAALVINFRNELAKYKVNSGAYTLLSLHGFTKEYDHRNRDPDNQASLHNKILIVDEAHNIRNQKSAISQVVVNVAASAHKVIALTGTPIQNRPCDIAPLLCMLKPRCVPITQAAFEERYGLSGLDAHRSEIKRAVHNSIAYYKPATNDPSYPSIEVREVMVTMHAPQATAHLQAVRSMPARDFEDLAKSTNLMAFLNGPRRAANAIKHHNKWYAAKLEEIVRRVTAATQQHQKCIIYSSFLEYGVHIISSLLKENGVAFAVITGDQNQDRKEKARVAYNTSKVSVLIFSKAGGEGMSLLNTSYVHVAEPSWQDACVQQVIGRSRRMGSHSGTNNHVTVYKYVALLPKKETTSAHLTHQQSNSKTILPRNKPRSSLEVCSADQILAELSARKERINRRFLQACIAWGA